MLPARIAIRIAIDSDTGCWNWTGSCQPNGYGRSSVGSTKWLAHRLVYTLLVGEIPCGLDLDHLCRNRRCVNPEHLEPVTRKINLLRGERANRTHCPQGHLIDGWDRLREVRVCRRCHSQRANRVRNQRRAEARRAG